jgi:hypothetical protein
MAHEDDLKLLRISCYLFCLTENILVIVVAAMR